MTVTVWMPVVLEDLVEQILLSRRITLSHRRRLQSVLLAEPLSPADLVLLDRLLYGVRRGILQVVD
ncbi:hypothetical protein ACN4EK_10855 [Pantanalinema rosaneae CENA516]|uniref:hypothetical protein n=1 Tax=Pantanalinema rosaneae TaxID=1620701 RepID=UPI003D6F9D16